MCFIKEKEEENELYPTGDEGEIPLWLMITTISNPKGSVFVFWAP